MLKREFIIIQITAVDMNRENLDGAEVVRYPLIKEQQINWQN